MPGNGEAEAGATGLAGAGFIYTVEALEDAVEMLKGDSLAEVADTELDGLDGVGQLAGTDDDAGVGLAAGLTVFDCVFDEVAEDLDYGVEVSEDQAGGGGADLEDGVGVVDETFHGVYGIADEDVGGDGGGVEFLLGGFDAGHHEEVFSETVHAGGVFMDGFEEFAGLRAEGGLVVEEGFNVSGDGGKRGTEFVGDVGDEVTLGALDLLDAGDVVQDGDCSTAGHGRGVDFEDATGEEGGGTAFDDDALVERGADALEDVRVADGLDECVADTDGAADGGTGDEALHALVGPLDAAGLIDGDNGILHAVDHGDEFVAAFGGFGEDVFDVGGDDGDGAGEAVEVLEFLVEQCDWTVGDGGGGGLELCDVLADGSCKEEGVDGGPEDDEGDAGDPPVGGEPDAHDGDERQGDSHAQEEGEEETTGQCRT